MKLLYELHWRNRNIFNGIALFLAFKSLNRKNDEYVQTHIQDY